MKRRKFLKAALVSSTIPFAAGTERLYGRPGSVLPNGGVIGEKFTLPLIRGGVPYESLRTLTAASQVLENVLTRARKPIRFH